MAPEAMYPEKFGFIGKYRKRLPSKSTDVYALGMTILEVSASILPLLRIGIFYDPLHRLLRGVVRSTAWIGTIPLCIEFSKGAGQTDRLQGSQTSCGSCW